MLFHPFEPQISQHTKKLLIGTLPPEGVNFYFSNSKNTRLWDLLTAIRNEQDFVDKGGNALNPKDKIETLDTLGVGIADIIYGYERDVFTSTKDKHIVPKKYFDILQLAVDNGITELLFVYQSAFKWFLHSIGSVEPLRLGRLKVRYPIGKQQEILYKGKVIKCTLLPAPLNRGSKGQTLKFKLAFYKEHILA